MLITSTKDMEQLVVIVSIKVMELQTPTSTQVMELVVVMNAKNDRNNEKMFLLNNLLLSLYYNLYRL